MHRSRFIITAGLLLAAGLLGCGGAGDGADGGAPQSGGQGASSRGGGGRGGPPWGGGGFQASAVPVEVSAAERRSISSYIETNGTLEAENEVDVVARAAGPLTRLATEEGLAVRRGDLLAKIDETEYRAQMEIARVALEEARVAFERAEELAADRLISSEAYEQARSNHDTAKAQFEASKILLDYTEVRAPFDGLIIARYVDFAQQVSNNTPLFRISDFDPLLCPIQVPERNLRDLRGGQKAFLTVEAFDGERFSARVLRISPIVDAATGTVKVTLELRDRRLRPGMFARVFLETANRPNAVVVPKAALALESVGDVVYVAAEGTAARREVTLGFSEGDFVEIASGVQAGEQVVVVGQDGLSDGTPIQVLRGGEATDAGDAVAESAPAGPPAGADREAGPPGGSGRRFPDLANATPEQLERIKGFMRARGMTEEQIEERLKAMRERQQQQADGS